MQKTMLWAWVMLIAGQAWAQTPFQEGVHYVELEQAPGAGPASSVEVTEAFSYLCNHCNTFEPYVQNWQQRLPEGVKFRRIPVEFGRQTWSLYARAYVAASVMGIADKSHAAMMDALWKEGRQMRSMQELADFYSGFGVDRDQFLATAGSFAVDMQMRREQQLVRQYGVNGTPTMIVNGKYSVSSGPAIDDFDVLLTVVDYLVARELAAAGQGEGAADTAGAATGQ